jgi:hypothetical protein
MNFQKIGLRMAALIAITAVLAGCATATASPTAAPTAASTIDQQATFAPIYTEAAGTVMAALTLNAPTATPVPPTSTPSPTATPAPTNTPLPPTAMPTATYIPWTATPLATATLTTYNCTITTVSPAAAETQKAGSDFDGRWVVENTGTQAWDHTAVDIKYLSGTKMQKAGEDLLDMKSDVAVGGSYTVIVDMIAPADAGTYYAYWALVQGSLTICNMNLTVVVVK